MIILMQYYIQVLELSSAVVCVLFDKMAAVAFMTQIIANHHKKSKIIFILAIYKRISVLSLTLLPSAKHGENRGKEARRDLWSVGS